MREATLDKYNKINSMSFKEWQDKCTSCNDCSNCEMALYKDLYGCTKNMCVRDMNFKKFKIEVDLCDAYFL
jgi:hypothetical protein